MLCSETDGEAAAAAAAASDVIRPGDVDKELGPLV